MVLQENIPLAPLTTFRVGGAARYYVEATTAEDVYNAVAHARATDLPLFVLGGGSNLVVSDAGWPGLALKIGIRGTLESETGHGGGKREFEAGAGEEWDSFVALTVARNCAGIETLSGIPGTVGGTPVQNVGAYGQEVAETICRVRALDLETMKTVDLTNADCGFSYRTSIFNSTHRGRYIVLRVCYSLVPGGKARIAYADLKKRFDGHGGEPTLQQVRDAVREIRLSKAMLIVPGDDDCRSAGSFFKNPMVEKAHYERVTEIAARAGKQPPHYPGENGKVKLSAAWLVENAGFPKGYSRGPVGISRRHTLALVNRGGATSADIIALKNEIQARVVDVFGIALQPEPVFVGFEP